MKDKSLLHALVTMILLPWYGIRVCPFLESLNFWQLTLPIVVILLAQQGVRYWLTPGWIDAADSKVQV
ncbi:MAG: hypothetical protein G8345_17715, partial [Magnetococcales bacterium]|nr:hypothetical protein [Magnetococcales bacterium]NGZ28715.1 hypothetical protein [Magnetococcales bacterium]